MDRLRLDQVHGPCGPLTYCCMFIYGEILKYCACYIC